MPVLICDPLPDSVASFLEERRRSGADRFDELWEGVLHVAPAPTGAHDNLLMQVMYAIYPLARERGLTPGTGGFNLGSPDDYRIPDAGIRQDESVASYFETAALLVEILSPDDETYAKLPFYAAHGVEEVLIVDPTARTVRWLGLHSGTYADITHSTVIDFGPEALSAAIDWPPTA